MQWLLNDILVNRLSNLGREKLVQQERDRLLTEVENLAANSDGQAQKLQDMHAQKLKSLEAQLKKEGRSHEYERHRLQALNQRQKMALQRKTEEAALATKRLKVLPESHKSSVRGYLTSNGTPMAQGNKKSFQRRLDHELEVLMNIREVHEYEKQEELAVLRQVDEFAFKRMSPLRAKNGIKRDKKLLDLKGVNKYNVYLWITSFGRAGFTSLGSPRLMELILTSLKLVGVILQFVQRLFMQPELANSNKLLADDMRSQSSVFNLCASSETAQFWFTDDANEAIINEEIGSGRERWEIMEVEKESPSLAIIVGNGKSHGNSQNGLTQS
ncbi:hypothetical protein ACH5RR_024803 [Cinchona calisaya]|uniref:Uncharacterized protein n=1 Tax=Cinchona calisaya TaxID=153742 RepID=A0ABD2YYM6_9GENT